MERYCDKTHVLLLDQTKDGTETYLELYSLVFTSICHLVYN